MHTAQGRPERVLILGATSAIASEVARLHVERGDRLHLVGRSRDKLVRLSEAFPTVGSTTADFGELASNETLVRVPHRNPRRSRPSLHRSRGPRRSARERAVVPGRRGDPQDELLERRLRFSCRSRNPYGARAPGSDRSHHLGSRRPRPSPQLHLRGGEGRALDLPPGPPHAALARRCQRDDAQARSCRHTDNEGPRETSALRQATPRSAEDDIVRADGRPRLRRRPSPRSGRDRRPR